MREFIIAFFDQMAIAAAIFGANSISRFAQWLIDRGNDVEWRRQNIVASAQWVIENLPFWASGITSWFLSLVLDNILNPILLFLRERFYDAARYVVGFYDNERGNYRPIVWLFDTILDIRDRLVNVYDSLLQFANDILAWVAQQITIVINAFQPAIQWLYAWKEDLSRWIGQNLYAPLQAVIRDIQTVLSAFNDLVQEVRSITSNPLMWVWEHVSPYLYEKIRDWLNSEWYVQR